MGPGEALLLRMEVDLGVIAMARGTPLFLNLQNESLAIKYNLSYQDTFFFCGGVISLYRGYSQLGYFSYGDFNKCLIQESKNFLFFYNLINFGDSR